MFLPPNTLLRNRYLIVRQISRGSMGAVYEAKDKRLGHRLALKQINLTYEAFGRAFEHKARTLAQLHHPSLPHLSDFFSSDGTHFLVMQYIPGYDLKESLDKLKKPFPVEEIVEWLDQSLEVLQYLHSHSPPIIHCDIKPANLKLSSHGRIILLDFGICKDSRLNKILLTTTDKSLFGLNLRYASLEQTDGQGSDQRSDLYSLAATFYHLLTATQLPTATTRAYAQTNYAPDPLLPANEINPQVPVGLANLLSQAMALNPDARPQSAEMMRAALQKAINNQKPITIKPPKIEQIRFEAENGMLSIAPPESLPHLAKREGLGRLGMLALLMSTMLSVTFLLMVVTQYLSLTGEHVGTDAQKISIVIPTMTVEPSATIKPSSTASPLSRPTFTVPPLLEATSTVPKRSSTTTPALVEPQPTITIEATSSPEPLAGASRISEKDGMTILYVPAGEFIMGSQEDDPLAAEHKHEMPQRTIFLDGFWIDQTEVTNAMFARFIKETEHETYAEKERKSDVYVGGGRWDEKEGASWQYPYGTECDCELEEIETHPVVHVTWDDARLYCKWAGRRLPTEAEWEKAARGSDGRRYPWGETELAGDLLNACDGNCKLNWANDSYNDGFEFTASVGSYPAGASPYGALDMVGNVWEWVTDWYDKEYYEQMPYSNPPGPESRQERVLRGGSWSSGEGWVRTAFRHRDPPTDPNDERGFRCASDP